MTATHTIVVDTREQKPLRFEAGTPIVRAKLDAGDYSLAGFERVFAIERKSLEDLCQTLTRGRDRFDRECQLLAEMRRACILVEADVDDLVLGRMRSQVAPKSVIGSLSAIHARYGISTVWAGSPGNAAALAASWLDHCARHFAAERREVAA